MNLPAPQRSKYLPKNWSPELRQEAYRSFCEHLSGGFSQESFVFECDEGSISYKTMLTWIKDEDEFPPEQKQMAIAKGHKGWESVLYDAAKGKNPDANPACLQMIMRNKYGWDRRDDRAKEQEPELLASYERLMVQLKGRQEENIIEVRHDSVADNRTANAPEDPYPTSQEP